MYTEPSGSFDGGGKWEFVGVIMGAGERGGPTRKGMATHTQLKLRFAAQTQTQSESLQKNVESGKY